MGRYSNKFVLCILVDGQVQKDLANGEVHIPFGTEYVVRLINKNDRRAAVDLIIDGENVGNFEVKAHGKLDVKRPVFKDAAFKFVDLESPEAYGEGKQGPNPTKEKGLVEARFKLEKANPKPAKVEHFHHYYPYYPPVVALPVTPQPFPKNPWRDPNVVWCGSNVQPAVMRSGGACDVAGSVLPGGNLTGAVPTNYPGVDCSLYACNTTTASHQGTEALASVMPATPSSPPLQEGCTVEGGRTGQTWVDVEIDTEDTETVLQLFLMGFTKVSPRRDDSYVSEGPHPVPYGDDSYAPPRTNMPEVPPLVTPANFCIQCGMARMSESAKFCGNCGNRF